MCELPSLCRGLCGSKLTAHEIGLVHLVLLPMGVAFIALADLFEDPIFELLVICEVALNVDLRCQLHFCFFWGGGGGASGLCGAGGRGLRGASGGGSCGQLGRQQGHHLRFFCFVVFFGAGGVGGPGF